MTKKIHDPVRAYLSAIGKKGGRVGGQSRSEKKLAALAENRNTAGRPKGAKDKQPRKPRGPNTYVSALDADAYLSNPSSHVPSRGLMEAERRLEAANVIPVRKKKGTQ